MVVLHIISETMLSVILCTIVALFFTQTPAERVSKSHYQSQSHKKTIQVRKKEKPILANTPLDIMLDFTELQTSTLNKIQFIELLYCIQNRDQRAKTLYRQLCKAISGDLKSIEFNEAAVQLLLSLNPVIKEHLGLIAIKQHKGDDSRFPCEKLKYDLSKTLKDEQQQIIINQEYNVYAQTSDLNKRPTHTKPRHNLLAYYLMCKNIERLCGPYAYDNSNQEELYGDKNPEFYARARTVDSIGEDGIPNELNGILAHYLEKRLQQASNALKK